MEAAKRLVKEAVVYPIKVRSGLIEIIPYSRMHGCKIVDWKCDKSLSRLYLGTVLHVLSLAGWLAGWLAG